MKTYILTIACPEKPGIVAAVATAIFSSGGNILTSAQYSDTENGRFFMRIELEAAAEAEEALSAKLARACEQLGSEYQLTPRETRMRVMLMASKQDHCLTDLLYRQRTGGLSMEATSVVSNHEDVASIAERYSLPFHHAPITPETKADQERQLRDIIDREQPELIVLARYMQVLTSEFCADFAWRVINIHHSFLPGFKGARPYHQAHARGVKMIGATAHYVTPDLDEGPIIEQDVLRVTHAHTPADLVRIGRDVEAGVLARAVKAHTERRVFANGVKTVVFD